MTDNATNELTEDNWRALTASVIRLLNEHNATLADRDRLAARCRELEAALAELRGLLGHVLKNGRLEDDEMADARAALGEQAADSEEA